MCFLFLLIIEATNDVIVENYFLSLLWPWGRLHTSVTRWLDYFLFIFWPLQQCKIAQYRKTFAKVGSKSCQINLQKFVHDFKNVTKVVKCRQIWSPCFLPTYMPMCVWQCRSRTFANIVQSIFGPSEWIEFSVLLILDLKQNLSNFHFQLG